MSGAERRSRQVAGHPRPRLLPMRRRHLADVVDLERQVHVSPWSAGLFEAELDRDDRHYLTAWSDTVLRRTLLGYGGVMLVAGDAHITTVAVAPPAQRRGVASHVVLALLEWAIDHDGSAATLEVRAGNVAAQRLYGSFGFAPVGVRPGYYATEEATGRGTEDAIIMWAYDVDRPAFRQRLDERREALGWPSRAHDRESGQEVA